ncbi:unnamed protein product, partial [marine sediment metagenome]
MTGVLFPTQGALSYRSAQYAVNILYGKRIGLVR